MKNEISVELIDGLATEAHVWFCNPEAVKDEEVISRYRSVLSDKEIEKYQRFNFEKDRHSYLVSHALTRFVLSGYLSQPAADIQFIYSDKGKPGLKQNTGKPELDFNITHTDGLCACVVTSGMACGVDVENINTKREILKVAQRMFATEETAKLNNENMQRQFCYYWTLREAYIKALGTGISSMSKDYYFDVNDSDMTADIHYKTEESCCWQFNIYEPTEAHVLSVAIETQVPVAVKVDELMP